jgi:hypothetical protein
VVAVDVVVVAGADVVVVASVVVALRAETIPVLKVPIIIRLVRRMLAVENAITLFFIPSYFLLITIHLQYATARTNASKFVLTNMIPDCRRY